MKQVEEFESEIKDCNNPKILNNFSKIFFQK